MELALFETAGLPDGAVLSVRAGNTRRQAPLPLQGPLRFPNLPFNAKQLKLDVMQTLGSAKCELKAAKELESYSVLVDMSDGGRARIGFTVREQPNLCGKRAAELKQADKQDGAVADADTNVASSEKTWAATDTRQYARGHNIPNFVQEMLQMVLRDKPDAPFSFMAEYLQKKAIELGENPGNETTMRSPPQSQKQMPYYSAPIPQDTGERTLPQKHAPYYNASHPQDTGDRTLPQKQAPYYSASIPQDTGERILPARNNKAAPSLPPRGGMQDEEGMLPQKSAPPRAGGLRQQPSAYSQPQKGYPTTYEDPGALQQPQTLQQPQPVAQKRVTHQLPADNGQSPEEEFGLRQIANKHKTKRMATSALEEVEPDDGDGEFYVPKVERGMHDDNSSVSYGGGPDGYVPKVPAQGHGDGGDSAANSYAKAAKPRSAADVARRNRAGAGDQSRNNQKSMPPGRNNYDDDYGAAPQVPLKRDDGGEPHSKRGLKSLPGPQKAAYRSARVSDDPERAQLEAEHMALQAERASLLHDLALFNQMARR